MAIHQCSLRLSFSRPFINLCRLVTAWADVIEYSIRTLAPQSEPPRLPTDVVEKYSGRKDAFVSTNSTPEFVNVIQYAVAPFTHALKHWG